MATEGSCTVHRKRSMRPTRISIALMALAPALPACTEYESSRDTLGSIGGSAFEPDRGSVMSRRPCAAASGLCSRSTTGRSITETSPLDDAGQPAPAPAEELDAGTPSEPDANPPQPGDTPLDCQGPGEFSGLAGAGCFVWVAEFETWEHARDACVAWGGALARIDSALEDELLAEHQLVDAWIGAHRSDVEEVVWADGAPITFTNWADDQPDDFEQSEDCVEKLQRNGQWNDAQCDQLNAYFCERR
jgi:hypothetical protein